MRRKLEKGCGGGRELGQTLPRLPALCVSVILARDGPPPPTSSRHNWLKDHLLEAGPIATLCWTVTWKMSNFLALLTAFRNSIVQVLNYTRLIQPAGLLLRGSYTVESRVGYLSPLYD